MEIKQRQISLGSPLEPGGSTYVIRSQNDLLQMAVDLEYLRLYKQNVIVTPRLHELIVERVLREQLILSSKISSLGVPQKLKGLFEIKTKSNAEKYCRDLQLNEFELFLLIHNCGQIDFKHHPKFHEHIPNHLTITDSDIENLHKGELLKYSKKLTSLLEFRKQSHAHLFESNNEWHVFYFNYSDVEEKNKGHWEEGPHLHYISRLWIQEDKDQILASFDQRRTKFSGYHIRFLQFEYPSLSNQKEIPVTMFGEQPMLLAINHNIPTDPISEPIPFAHLTTRGIWISSIAIVPD